MTTVVSGWASVYTKISNGGVQSEINKMIRSNIPKTKKFKKILLTSVIGPANVVQMFSDHKFVQAQTRP